MSILIFVLSLILLIAAGASGYSSIDLLPTSLGVLYALAGAVAACAAVVTFAVAVLIRRIDALRKLACSPTATFPVPPGFGVDAVGRNSPAGEVSAAHRRLKREAAGESRRSARGRGREPDQHQPRRASAFARGDRNGSGDARRAAGVAEPDRQLFVGRGQLQDLLRRLDRGRNERGNIPVRLDGRLQAPSHRDKGQGDVRKGIEPRFVWVFLGSGRFATKTPDYERWISLDFLVPIRSSPPKARRSTGCASAPSRRR